MSIWIEFRLRIDTPSAGWLDVTGPGTAMQVSRPVAQPGTISAQVLDATLDPTQTDQVKMGKAAELSVRNADGTAWVPIYTGALDDVQVERSPLARPGKTVKVTFSAVDALSYLANTPERRGVATIDDLRWLVTGVPFVINGASSATAPGTVIAGNDNASLWDQVLIARDTALGFAWIDGRGRLQVWDADTIDDTPVMTIGPDRYASLDTDFALEQVVNSVTVVFRRYNIGTDTSADVTYGPYEDAASIAQWGRRSASYTIQAAVEDEVAIADYAAAILARTADATLRPRSARIPIRDHADLDVVRDVDLCSVVDVVLHDGVTTMPARVAGIDHEVGSAGWVTVLTFESTTSTATSLATPSTGISVVPPGTIGLPELHDDVVTSLESADGKSRVFYSATPPVDDGTFRDGYTWFNINGGQQIARWVVGTGWVTTLLDTEAIADAAVVTSKIEPAAVIRDRIAATAIDASKIDVNAVTTTKINDLAVTNAKVGNAAITTAKIDNLAVTSALIADLAVGTAKIADLAVSGAKIANAAIVTAKIGDGQITNAKIGDAEIQSAKIANLDAGKVTTGTLDAARIAAKSITVDKLAVGDFTNYVRDGQMNSLGTWAVQTGTPTATQATTAGVDGGNDTVMRLTANAAAQEMREAPFTVLPLSELLVAGYARRLNTASTTGTLTFVLYWTDATGASLGSTTVVSVSTSTMVGGTWTRYTGAVVVPAGAVGAQIGVRLASNVTVGGLYDVDRLEVRRKSTGELIVDGAINGKTILGATVVAGSSLSSGERLVFRQDGSGGIIEAFTGIAGETAPGTINPGIAVGTLPGIEITAPTSTGFPGLGKVGIYPGDVEISAANIGLNGALNLYNPSTGVFKFGVDTSGKITSQGSYGDTTTAAANAFWASDAHLARSTSLRKFKLKRERLTADAVRGLLDVPVMSWFDRGQVKDNGGKTDGLKRIPGLVAEDVEKHAPLFATYDNDGLTGVAYDRVGAALIPLVNELFARVEALEAQVAELTSPK